VTWLNEWKAISDQIQGLLEAGQFYLRCLSVQREDTYGVGHRELIPQMQEIFVTLNKFADNNKAALNRTAASSLEKFLYTVNNHYRNPNYRNLEPLTVIQAYLTALTSFRTQFTYHISDVSAFIKRLSERAFMHLQRSIVSDRTLQKRWEEAFDEGERACEKLGSVHLLLHGIWAFKVNAEGERTDLVFGEPLKDLTEAEKTAEGLVLTEWKRILEKSELNQKINAAHKQASRYASGILGGLELAQYRYLVLVSKDVLAMPPDLLENGITYRHINIAVVPKPPSMS